MKLKEKEVLTKWLPALRPKENVKAYQVIELFEKDDKTRVEQHYFTLASSVQEAINIVGKDERREIIFVKELFQITQLPSDVYRVGYAMPKL